MKLSEQQLKQFDEQGYAHFPNAITGPLFDQLKADVNATQQWGFARLKQNQAPADFAFTYRYLLPYLNRITQFHLYAGSASLAVLGSPQVLALAQSLCGEKFLPTVDMLILKNQHDELDLPWHQDLIFDSSKYRVIALGIYLEDALAGDGALKLVKGSHGGLQDIDAIMQDSSLEIIEIPAKAGDILIHNPMLVHWSDMLQNQPQRRTLYYEFRPIEQVQDQEQWPVKIIHQRLGILHRALDEFKRQHPEKPQFPVPSWLEMAASEDSGSLQDLYAQKIPFRNANFIKSLSDHLVKKS